MKRFFKEKKEQNKLAEMHNFLDIFCEPCMSELSYVNRKMDEVPAV